mgnify:CR=1 FL=1
MTGYSEFGNYLDNQGESFSIKFDKVEEIIGEKLPSSAKVRVPYNGLVAIAAVKAKLLTSLSFESNPFAAVISKVDASTLS